MVTAQAAFAQSLSVVIGRNDTLPAVFLKAIRTTTSTSLSGQDPFRLVEHPVSVPNFLEGDSGFRTAIKMFDRLPGRSGALPTDDAHTILAALTKISKDVEFSSRILSDLEKQQLKEARKLLFQDENQTVPTSTYSTYLTFKSQRDEQARLLRSETTPAGRANILQKIANINQNWEISGFKNDVELALARIASLDDRGPSTQFAEWKNLISDGSEIRPSSISSAFVEPSWIRFSASVALDDPEAFSLLVDGAKSPLPQPTRLSFEFLRLQISRNALEARFLFDTTWRNKFGFILSDGNSATDDDSELLPRVVSELILVKNVEIALAADITPGAMAALKSGRIISLLGFPLQQEGIRDAVFQLRYLGSARPSIVGYAILEMPKIPNPAPGRNWN
ncbi:hypothetical protein [Bradyrhizobium stylosanthis]|uniref:Uncharacterized protein n=1 Tax=Bradyrhizobium stylosanthis TaxID=1803665 RepID=A0A560ECT5_9BRAD|nr:hypothetical protein [Bradyrhizobium stylosanthis]TWB07187.1 hypothetical protein FBZ96_1011005 [Bradyrhizobium stylosanthis]